MHAPKYVVFLFVVCGAAAPSPTTNTIPMARVMSSAPIDTRLSLFWAIQTMPDLYGSISAFNLPYIALGPTILSITYEELSLSTCQAKPIDSKYSSVMVLIFLILLGCHPPVLEVDGDEK